MIISIDAAKAFGRIQHLLVIITLRKLGVVGNFLILMENIYNKPTDIMAFKNDTKQLCFPTKT